MYELLISYDNLNLLFDYYIVYATGQLFTLLILYTIWCLLDIVWLLIIPQTHTTCYVGWVWSLSLLKCVCILKTSKLTFDHDSQERRRAGEAAVVPDCLDPWCLPEMTMVPPRSPSLFPKSLHLPTALSTKVVSSADSLDSQRCQKPVRMGISRDAGAVRNKNNQPNGINNAIQYIRIRQHSQGAVKATSAKWGKRHIYIPNTQEVKRGKPVGGDCSSLLVPILYCKFIGHKCPDTLFWWMF